MANVKKRTRAKAQLSPAEIVRRLSALYGEPVSRPHGDPMAELVLTILSQNTSDTNSGRAFMRLVRRFPDWRALMDAPMSEIEREIAVGGLAKQKAPRIKASLDAVWVARGSFDLEFLREMPLDEAKSWLREMKGVGPKTAACVLMFSFGLPALPVDTHVHRVAQRLGLVPERATAEQAHDILEAMLEPDLVFPFHIMLIKHGRRLCGAQRPRCEDCPLLEGCPVGQAFTKAARRKIAED
ncbi:MAG TPA: endonuclease III [Dehalococcoidia bacterium]